MYNNMELSPRKILFGVDAGKHYDLNLFLLLAKWFIWKQSKNESVVTVRLFFGAFAIVLYRKVLCL